MVDGVGIRRRPRGAVGVETSRRPAQDSARGGFQGTRVQRKDPVMQKVFQSVANFLKREDGPTAVEYAVMLALIIVVCITAITAIGTNANKTFNNVASNLTSAT
jgi:pilus assembly protein Flp/PilA